MEIAQRVAELNWKSVVGDLDNVGIAAVGTLLGRGECRDLSAVYDQIARFRSTIDVAHHRFGEGQYRYFAHPLPRGCESRSLIVLPDLLSCVDDELSVDAVADASLQRA
jgi:hypothetical protein